MMMKARKKDAREDIYMWVKYYVMIVWDYHQKKKRAWSLLFRCWVVRYGTLWGSANHQSKASSKDIGNRLYRPFVREQGILHSLCVCGVTIRRG
jgi:hypothetical protein